jgi:hypothetical protein
LVSVVDNSNSSSATLSLPSYDLTFVIPRPVVHGSTAFYLGDVGRFLSSFVASDRCAPFDLVLMDPPWPNRSATRSNRYCTLRYADELDRTLMQPLLGGGVLNATQAVLAVWMTNKRAVRDYVERQLLPQFFGGGAGDVCDNKTTVLAEWHWLKVADNMQPTVPLESTHRRPHETLLIACRGADYVERLIRSGRHRWTILAVPGAHSRKPPVHSLLTEVFANATSADPLRCLELFSRSLSGGWTSCGNEVLLFQDSKLFSCSSDTMEKHQ